MPQRGVTQSACKAYGSSTTGAQACFLPTVQDRRKYISGSVNLISLCKRFDNNIPAVRDVDLEVRDGEFLVLVGSSGSGKSTTLKMIAGLEEVSEGEIHIGNRNVTYLEPKDRNIAMVFQNYALYPHMDV